MRKLICFWATLLSRLDIATNFSLTTTYSVPLHDDAGDDRPGVLVIGSDDLFDRVSDALARKYWVRHCLDGLHGLGDLAFHRADHIIGHFDIFHNRPAILSALKEIAPRVKIHMVCNSFQAGLSETNNHAGIDSVIDDPIDCAGLIGHLEQEELPLADPKQTICSDKPRPAVEIGDVDQVAELLKMGGEPIETSLKIITQHTGLDGLDFSCSAPEENDEVLRIPVVHRQQKLGYLTARLAGNREELEETLGPWCVWLGHWVALSQRLRMLEGLAYTDDLTGAWNRRYFYQFLDHLLRKATDERFQVTVMVYDIDDFKKYNDQYGHAAGDQILCQTVKLMQSVVRKHDIVARIGGDEFAVIFWDQKPPRKEHSQHPSSVKIAAARFQKAICNHKFPKLLTQALGTLTISGGLASFPWDGTTSEVLVAKADDMALQSKKLGKNAITFGPGAQHTCQLSASDADL